MVRADERAHAILFAFRCCFAHTYSPQQLFEDLSVYGLYEVMIEACAHRTLSVILLCVPGYCN